MNGSANRGRFTPEFLDGIRDRVPLTDIVSPHVALKRSGREFVGLSPFQAERTPSFTVVPEKGFYHCFSSGEHGDVIDFVMKIEGLSFPDAVEKLAAQAGIHMPRGNSQAEVRPRRPAPAPAPRRPPSSRMSAPPTPGKRDSTPDDAAGLCSRAVPAQPGGATSTWLHRRDGGGVWGGPRDTPLPDAVREIAAAAFRSWTESVGLERSFWLPDTATWVVCYRYEIDGRTRALQLEALDSSAERIRQKDGKAWKRTLGSPGSAAMFRVEAEGGGPLAVAEGSADALAIAWHIGRDAWARGTQLRPDQADLLAHRGRPIEIWPDMDAKGNGQASATALYRALMLRRVPVTWIDIPLGSDPAEWLANGGRPDA